MTNEYNEIHESNEDRQWLVLVMNDILVEMTKVMRMCIDNDNDQLVLEWLMTCSIILLLMTNDMKGEIDQYYYDDLLLCIIINLIIIIEAFIGYYWPLIDDDIIEVLLLLNTVLTLLLLILIDRRNYYNENILKKWNDEQFWRNGR